MSAKTIKQLDEDGKKIALEIKSIHDKGDDATPDELLSLEVKSADLDKISEVLEKFSGEQAGLKAINRLENTHAVLKTLNRPGLGHDGASLNGGNGSDPAYEIKTLNQRFEEHDAFQSWLKSVAPKGYIPNGVQATSPGVELKTLYTTAADIVDSRPMLGQADRRPGIVPLNWTPLVLRDMITNLTTMSDLVEIVREKNRANNADFVAEATSTSGSSGASPESALEWEVLQQAVQSISHSFPTSSRVLSDARQLAGAIDAFLRTGLDQKVESAMLTANGTSPAFTGLNNASGLLTQTYTTSVLTTTRKARTKLKVTGHAIPTAWLMHPNDAELVDLQVDGQQRYYFGGPMELGNPRLWGVPVIESEYQTEGAPVLGDFKMAAAYDREQTGVTVSNQHLDFFNRGLVLLRAEVRLAFAILRSASFISVDVIA